MIGCDAQILQVIKSCEVAHKLCNNGREVYPRLPRWSTVQALYLGVILHFATIYCGLTGYSVENSWDNLWTSRGYPEDKHFCAEDSQLFDNTRKGVRKAKVKRVA